MISWKFKQVVREPDLKGTLSIDYSVVIWTTPKNNCEQGAGFNCYRFVPKVSYLWEGLTPEDRTLRGLTAFYRLDYGSVGFALTKDSDTFFPSFLYNNLYRQDIQTKEIVFDAVKVGRAGDYDNIHTVHENQQVIIPSCGRMNWFDGGPLGFIFAAFKKLTQYNAFDCVHMHWRWSKSDTSSAPGGFKVDPMVEPTDNSKLDDGLHEMGTPNLVPGQTIRIGIVRQDTPTPPGTPKDPDDPLKDINMETIATTHNTLSLGGSTGIFPKRPEKTLAGLFEVVQDGDKMKRNPTSTIVWYVATDIDTGFLNSHDTFFRHGIFVIDPLTKKAELEGIRSNLQVLAMGESEKKKAAILAQVNDVLRDNNWTPDGNALVDQNGESVFTGLSRAASLLVEARNESPAIVGSLNEALSELLSATQNIVNADLQKRIIDTIASETIKQQEFEKLFANNAAVQKSIEGYISSSNMSDVTMAAQVINNFKESWMNGVHGINQISTELTRVTPKPTDAPIAIPIT